jgi:hypothetical protein
MMELSAYVVIIGTVGTAVITLYAWLLARNAGIYATFDTLYQEALNLGLQYPLCRDPAKTLVYRQSLLDDDLVRYETYAYMVLNVCETVADSLDLYGSGERRPYELVESLFGWLLPPIADRRRLRRTWEPVLKAEARLHRTWIDQCEAGVRFKEDFLTLMKSYVPQERISARR